MTHPSATDAPLATAGADISVQVAYAEPRRAVVRTYRMTAPVSVGQALLRARSDPAFAGVAIQDSAVGVFGRVVSLAHELRDGDRVEIYRPLAADPKSARRERVKEARKRR